MLAVDDVVEWIKAMFDDCQMRAPFGVGWSLDRAEPPLTATVTPADCSTGQFVLRRDGVNGRITFAQHVQAFLNVELGTPVPPCPTHQLGLVPVRADDAVAWRCPRGDFDAAVGDYREALWPPGPDMATGDIAPMLARRFRRRRLTGISSFGIQERDSRRVAAIRLRPDADDAAIRAAADPIPVEIEQVDAVRTVRSQRPATDREPAHRALTIVGAPMRLAAKRGTLRRAAPTDDCDVFVGETRVHLIPEHRIGASGGPFVLDADGLPFANEGDPVCCVGGYAPPGPIQDTPGIFNAGELRVYE
jgi:hypothetical protein